MYQKIKTLALLCLTVISTTVVYGQTRYYWSDGHKVSLQEDRSSMVVQFKKEVSPKAVLQKKRISKSVAKQVEIHENKGRAIFHFASLQKNTSKSIAKSLGLSSDEIQSVSYGWKLSDGFQVWVTDKVVVRLKEGYSLGNLQGILAKYGAKYAKKTLSNTILVKVKDLNDALPLSNEIRESGMVQWSHPDFYAKLTHYADPLLPAQFQMHNTGQTIDGVTGVNDMDANALEAWGVTTGSSNITVAVIDDGVESHEDLSTPIAGYTPANNGNGTPTSSGAHGVSCAGIIAAKHNGIGVQGVAPGVNLITANIFFGGETTSDLANTFAWAKNNGADVISNSWGYPSCTFVADDLTSAIADAKNNGRGGKGCVIVFASGNGYKTCVDYPAYLSTVIAVGAFTNQGVKSEYSNAGSALDIAAPSNAVGGQVGAGVRTTDRMGGSGYNSTNYTNSFGGTSAACPVVAGVAALVLSANENLTATEVENILYSTATDMGAAGRDDSYGHGRVNAFGAVEAAGGTPPPPPPGCEYNEVTLTMKFDDYPEETSWEVLNESDEVVASGGTYPNAPDGSTLGIDLCLPDGCYTLVVKDSYGDGMCCRYGNGAYTLTDKENSVLASGGSFASSDSKPFCVGGKIGNNTPTLTLNQETIVPVIQDNGSFISYPNPAENYINVWNQGEEGAKLKIVTPKGKVLKSIHVHKGANVISLDDLEPGLYFIEQGEKIERFLKK